MTYKNMSRTTNLIDEYINNQDPEHRSNLYAVRDTIREQLRQRGTSGSTRDLRRWKISPENLQNAA